MHNVIQKQDYLLNRLISAMGKDDVSDAERAELEMDLQELKGEYEKSCLRRAATTHEGRRVMGGRELLKKLLAKKAEIRELRRQLGDRKYEVARKVNFRLVEDKVPLEEFKRIVPLSDPDTLEEMEEVEGLNMKYLLNQGAAEYRKRPLRMHLIEPFLIILNRRGVVASPRDLPLSHMTDALFDWVGIKQMDRHTNTGIRAIARYIARWIEEREAQYRESSVTQRPIN